MKKSLLFFAIGLFLFAEFPAPAKACSCIEPPPPSIAFHQYDAIFLARVNSFERTEDGQRRVAGMAVYEIWKGKAGRTQPVYTALNSAACGYDFQVGEVYIVYASRDANGDLSTHLCTRTAPKEYALDDLRYLNARRYLPLEINNRWEFTRDVAETVQDTVRYNDALYYRFDNFRGNQNAGLRISDGGQVIMYYEGLEQVWVDFSAEIGDSREVLAPDSSILWTVHLQSISDTVRVPAGEYANCYRFYFQFHGDDNDWVEWYAPDAGPVKRDLSGIAFFEFDLKTAALHFPGVITEVSPPNQPIKHFTLFQNYPNPLNIGVDSQSVNAELTTIRYNLTRDGFARLEIIDILGRVVRTLVEAPMKSGRYEIAWNGRKENGALAAHGIYFYRLRVGGEQIVKKLVVMRSFGK